VKHAVRFTLTRSRADRLVMQKLGGSNMGFFRLILVLFLFILLLASQSGHSSQSGFPASRWRFVQIEFLYISLALLSCLEPPKELFLQFIKSTCPLVAYGLSYFFR